MKSPATVDNPRMTVLREKYFVCVILLVTAITYMGTLRFDFVSDDHDRIVFNPFVKSWHFVAQYFFDPATMHPTAGAPGNYYRPLFLLSTRLNYWVFANRSLGWHLVAVAFHLLVTWLTYVLIRKMSGEFAPAWLAALIFGLHPIHHEVVAWISGMSESFFAILLLASFLGYLRSLEGSKTVWMTFSCTFYALALLSKETAIILPALVFAYGWIRYGPSEDQDTGDQHLGLARRLTRALTPAMFYLPIAFLYLLLRHRVLSGLSHSESKASVASWFITLPSVLLFYIKNWFLPVRLSESYDVFYQPNFNFAHVFLPAFLVCAVVVTIWILRKRLGTKSTGYAAVWILIPLLPALNTFVFRWDQIVHDRYFYVPSIGAAFLIALIVVHAAKSRLAVFGQPLHVVAAGLALAVVLGFLAVRAASFWANDYAMFSRAHQVAPRNVTASSGLGEEMLLRGEMDEAQSLLEESYKRRSDDYRIAYNLSRLHYARHQYPKAEEYGRQAIALSPNFSDAYISLGAIELKLGHGAEAEQTLGLAVKMSPDNVSAHTSYGIVLAMNGDCAAAMQQFETSLALNPGDAMAQVQMFRCRAANSPAPRPAS